RLYIVPNERTERPQVPNNLPVKSARLVGREREVASICDLLIGDSAQDTRVRLLTLVGPGGVGKTRLASQVAEELLGLEGFEDGVYFVDLASTVEANLVAPTIATTLQVREAPGTSLLSTLIAHLQGKRMLLVLD